jgi:hypothetical protein
MLLGNPLRGSVNAKNSYGAYTGERVFIYFLKLGQVHWATGGSSGSDELATVLIKKYCLGD